MADVLMIASVVCFVLAVILLIAAVALFFVWNIKKVWAELQGRNLPPASGKIRKNKKTQKPQKNHEGKTAEATEKNAVCWDEAVTVLDNGEISGDSLVSCYEPGTELSVDLATETAVEEKTEMDQDPFTAAELQDWQETTEPAEKDTQRDLWEETENNDWVENGFQLKRDVLLANPQNALDHLF